MTASIGTTGDARATAQDDNVSITQRVRAVPALGLVALLLSLWAIAFVAVPRFDTASNFFNILRQSSDLIVVAVGIMFVLLIAGIDLSVGSIYGLTAVVLVTVMVENGNVGLALLAAVGVGIAAGAINGVLVEWFRVPPFITTLGTFYIAFAVAQMVSAGSALQMPRDTVLSSLARTDFFGVPALAVLAGVIAVFGWVLLNRTTFGRSAVSIGYNREASRLSGVQVSRVTIGAYTVSGTLAAIGAIMLSSRIQSGEPTLGGFTQTFEVITAAVVGGTSLFGGRGTILGVVVGALIIRTIGNCITLLNITPLLYQAVMGSLILIALIAEALRMRYVGTRA